MTKLEKVRFLDRLVPYPAVLWPVPEGGLEVIFPNFADLKAFGITREAAVKAGSEILTAEILKYAVNKRELPKASDPERLIADEDEPPGTELVMLEPDRRTLIRYLGLEKKDKATVLGSLGVFGKK
jgi:predicted RNase H-like HicB family nuclease